MDFLRLFFVVLLTSFFAGTVRAEDGQLLIFSGQGLYSVPVRGAVYAGSDWMKNPTLDFWEVMNDNYTISGIGESDETVSLKTLTLSDLTVPPAPAKTTTGDCGIEEEWQKNAKRLADLPPSPAGKGNIDRYGIIAPPGFSLEQGRNAEKELKSLVLAEQGKREEEPSDASIEASLSRSAKFSNRGQVLWYINSHSDLKNYVTIYYQSPVSYDNDLLGTYDFVTACP